MIHCSQYTLLDTIGHFVSYTSLSKQSVALVKPTTTWNKMYTDITRMHSECAYIRQANNKILIGVQKTYYITRSKGSIQQVWMVPPFESEQTEQNKYIDGATVFDFAILYVNLFYCMCYFFTFLLLSFKIKIVILFLFAKSCWACI